ncbi:hypothetical protein [Nocardia sp. NPDC051832]|uniref:WXG100 family type VII secretion target n=1 Tax=Nocardia sp. NPDC051832 TaxID=3155673 RepID=UPI00343E50DD
MREIQVTTERWPHTRTDPDYVPSVEIFDNITHKEIHDKVQLMDPTVLSAGQQAWQQTATGLADAVTLAHTEIRATIADGWRGGAAQTAADAVRAFEQQGSQLADVMSTVAQRLGQAGDAAESLRSAVGIPSGEQPDLSAALLDPNQATGNAATQKAVENDRQDVVAAMESIYTNAFIQSGAGVPAFPDATVVDAPAPAANPSSPVLTAQAPVLDPGSPATQPVSTVPGTTQPPAQAPEPAAAEPEPGATTPASVLPVTSLLGTALPGDTTPAAASTVPATAATAPTTPVAAATPERVAPAPAGAPVAPAAAAPTVPSGFATTTAGADDERKREERKRDTSTDAVTGAGVGAMGGLMGGALAAGGDTPRSGGGPGPRPAAASSHDDEDEDDELHWTDDELTFLEPADEPRELIGSMDPTTPPVVGEWTELE